MSGRTPVDGAAGLCVSHAKQALPPHALYYTKSNLLNTIL